MESTGLTVDERIQRGVNNPLVPKIYFNSFVNLVGTCDTVLVFEMNGSPTAVANMSYTMTKTLAERLTQMVKELEEVTGRKIMTTDFVEERVLQRGAKAV